MKCLTTNRQNIPKEPAGMQLCDLAYMTMHMLSHLCLTTQTVRNKRIGLLDNKSYCQTWSIQ